MIYNVVNCWSNDLLSARQLDFDSRKWRLGFSISLWPQQSTPASKQQASSQGVGVPLLSFEVSPDSFGCHPAHPGRLRSLADPQGFGFVRSCKSFYTLTLTMGVSGCAAHARARTRGWLRPLAGHPRGSGFSFGLKPVFPPETAAAAN